MTPYDWATERDRQRWLRPVAVWIAYIGALTLIPAGLWYLTVGQPIGLAVWAIAAAIWLTAWGLDVTERKTRR